MRFRHQVANRLPVKGDLEEDQGILRHGDQGKMGPEIAWEKKCRRKIAESMPLAIIGGCWGLYDVMICYVMLFAYRIVMGIDCVSIRLREGPFTTPHTIPYLLIPRAGAEASQLWLHMALVLLWHPSLAPSGVAGDGHVNQP